MRSGFVVAIVPLLLAASVRAQPPAEPPAEPPAPPAAEPVDSPTPPPTPPAALPSALGLPEPKSTLPAPGPQLPPDGDISLDDWRRDDWMLLKPAVSLFELDGYFRLRGDMFRRLDFGNAAATERLLDGSTDLGPRYDATPVGEANYVSSNMRLRLEPIINVNERIQIITTFDLLDNLVLGSTPNTLPPIAGGYPVNVLATSQNPARAGVNALGDSLTIKRTYARLTALNEQLELRFGRMPNHWGLGMMANDGDCLDCDYGDVVDRVAVGFKAANHLFAPMFDWVSSGPVIAPFGRTGGQPIDAIDRDDVVQYSLRIERADHPEDVRDRLARGEAVLNYGVWNLLRTQDRDLGAAFYAPGGDVDAYDPAAPLTADLIEKRDAFLYTLDAYGKLQWGDFSLALEGAFIWGSFNDTFYDQSANAAAQKTQIFKLGGVLEGAWRLPGQRLGSELQLRAGGASGDSMPGVGALDRADTQRGLRGGSVDRELENFQFSPDYHVDLLVFRRILGTVTDAWYLSPGVTYMFDDRFSGRLWAVYSQSIFKRSVPGDSHMMALEFDAELAYGLSGPDDGPGSFGASLAGGMAFPFGAFDNLTLADNRQGGSFAWTIQARLFLLF